MLLIFGCSFFRPHPSLRSCPLESFAIASTAHARTHRYVHFYFPRHGEISGLERATPSNCALWKRRVNIEKYSILVVVFRNLSKKFRILNRFHYDFYFYVSRSRVKIRSRSTLSIGPRKENSSRERTLRRYTKKIWQPWREYHLYFYLI